MAIFRNRVPPGRDIALVFAACAFPVHLWTILRMLAEVPAWRLHLSLAELVGAAAYTLTFALLESVALLTVFVLLGALRPAWIRRDRFVAKSSVLVILTFAAAITAHLGVIQPWRFDPNLTVAVVLYAASVALSLYVVGHYPYLEGLKSTTVQHLMVPSFLYLGLDVVGVLLFTLAVLTKETTLILVAGYLLSLLAHRQWRRYVGLALGMGIPFLLWQEVLWAWLGQPGFGSGRARDTDWEILPFRKPLTMFIRPSG